MKRVLFLLLSVCILAGCANRSRSSSSGGGYSPSFMGSGDTESCAYILRTVTAFYSNGASAGRFEVVQRGSYQYARKEGGTQEYNIIVDYQNGFNYVFWNGASWLYFY